MGGVAPEFDAMLSHLPIPRDYDPERLFDSPYSPEPLVPYGGPRTKVLPPPPLVAPIVWAPETPPVRPLTRNYNGFSGQVEWVTQQDARCGLDIAMTARGLMQPCGLLAWLYLWPAYGN